MRLHRSSLPVLTCLLLFAGNPVNSAPSGLNIIPTADILPVGQASAEAEFVGSNLIPNDENDFALLYQYGISDSLELGIDRTISGSTGTVCNCKCCLLREQDSRPAVAAGIQNIGNDMNDQLYCVATKSVDRNTRIHIGGISMDDENEYILGVDSVLTENLVFQADYTSGDENLWSLGIACNLSRNLSVTAARLIANSDMADNGYLLNISWTPNL